jgi:hypothetical protein
MWPLHFKHSHWWKRWSRSKFAASHYTRGTKKVVCECKMDVTSTQIPTWHQMDHASWSLGLFSKNPPLGGKPNTKPRDNGTLNAHHHRLILFHHVRGPVCVEIHRISMWLRARSHTTSHYHSRRIRDHTTTWHWRCVGPAFGHFLLGSHNVMVTALGSSTKWPYTPTQFPFSFFLLLFPIWGKSRLTYSCHGRSHRWQRVIIAQEAWEEEGC